MNRRLARRLALTAGLAGTVLYLLTIPLAILNRDTPLPSGWGEWGGLSWVIFTFIPMLLSLWFGVLLVTRLPDNPYGWVWIVLGLSFGPVMGFFQSYAIYTLLVTPSRDVSGWIAAGIASYGWFVGFSMVPLVLLLFPTGRPPSPRWRIVVWFVLAALFVGLATGWAIGTEGIVPVTNPGPGGPVGSLLQMISGIAVGVIFVAIPVSTVSLFVRYRRANHEVRQQLKWFLFGAAVFGVSLASDFVYSAPDPWEQLKEAALFAILPLTIGIAILRYRLWDIDVIIRKTVVYAILTVLLALVYFGAIIVFQLIFESVSGEQSAISIVISTLVIAALFSPLRRQVQDFIDRRFFRRRYDAEQTLAAFGRSVRDETDLEMLVAELLRVTEETMQPNKCLSG